ncbi:MAG: hypothetical protein WC951_00790 [Bacteroidales bacterium]
MKKQNLLKLAFTMLAMVFMTGVMAQEVTAINHDDDAATGTNYVEAATTETYQTVGIDLRLYVRPDVVYSPSYTGTGAAGTGLNDDSRWRWVSGADYAGGTEVKAATKENWVDITGPAASTPVTYWVLESNTAFSCVGDATSHVVNGVAVPSADFVGVGTGWDVVTANYAFRRCASGTDIGDVLNITLTEDGAPTDAQEYTYGITATQQALDANLEATGTPTDVTDTYGKSAAPTILVAGLNPTHTIPSLPLIDASTPTQYIFTITSNSIYSNISIRSQLRGGVTQAGYNGAATTITYTLLPVPTTGPIFHIPNNF